MEIETVRRQLNIFGLHAMRLDLRGGFEPTQWNDGRKPCAPSQITANFAEMPEQERLALLTKLLGSDLLDSLSKLALPLRP